MCSVAESCLTLCDLTDYSLSGSSVHGIIQARIKEWVAISSSKGSSWPIDWSHTFYVSCIGRQILFHWFFIVLYRYCFFFFFFFIFYKWKVCVNVALSKSLGTIIPNLLTSCLCVKSGNSQNISNPPPAKWLQLNWRLRWRWRLAFFSNRVFLKG